VTLWTCYGALKIVVLLFNWRSARKFGRRRHANKKIWLLQWDTNLSLDLHFTFSCIFNYVLCAVKRVRNVKPKGNVWQTYERSSETEGCRSLDASDASLQIIWHLGFYGHFGQFFWSDNSRLITSTEACKRHLKPTYLTCFSLASRSACIFLVNGAT